MPQRFRIIAPYAALIAAVLVAFSPAMWNGFVYFDDDAYITQNPHVANGIGLEGVRWATTGILNANWHPLTWWSHMLDVSLFGMNAWGHHLHSILLHALSAMTLYALLRRWGLAAAPALLAALVWAVHPLRVESVVWASERKDVLSVLFGLLSLLAYDAYARRGQLRALAVALGCFALGLMAKPMLVTLPCVLLVLDVLLYTRLSPTPSRANARVLLEKIPFFLLTLASVALTLWAQRNALQSTEMLSLGQRFAVATYAATTYLQQTFLPTALTPLYPMHSDDFTPLGTLVRGAVLVLITGMVFALYRARLPLVGWLIFLGTLVPVSGILQVGNQSHADRYTYLPSLGLALVMGWALHSFADKRTYRGMGVPVLCLLIATSAVQTQHWRNTETLFTHTLAHTHDNSVAHNNLGRYQLEQGRTQEALTNIEEAVRIAPANTEARFNLGSAYLLTGEPRKAIAMLAPLMPIYLHDPDFHLNLALAMHETHDKQFPVVANNALQLLPQNHPARPRLLQYLKDF